MKRNQTLKLKLGAAVTALLAVMPAFCGPLAAQAQQLSAEEMERENKRLLDLEAQLLRELERGPDTGQDMAAPAAAVKEPFVEPEVPAVEDEVAYETADAREDFESNHSLSLRIAHLEASIDELEEENRRMKQHLEKLGAEEVRWEGEPQSLPQQPNVWTVTVVQEPAVLRSSPSRNAGRLMNISAGSRLPVELRRGSWYRVVAGNGVRAWLPEDVTIP